MGLFKSKEEKQLLKAEKLEGKERAKNDLEHFKKNSSLKIEAVLFDDSLEKFMVKKDMILNRKQITINYSDLVSYTPIIQEGKIKKHHGITRAIVGGAMAGPVGALVGAGTGGKELETIKKLGFMLQLKENKTFDYLLISTETKTDSLLGKTYLGSYNKLASKFDQIISNNSKGDFSKKTHTDVEELREYKQLLDDGVITSEEFNKKKSKILNL